MSDTPRRSNDSLATIVVMLITVAVLYVGSEIFVPFALAILLSFLLAPPVAWLRRIHMPRTAVRRLKARSPVLKVMLGAWNPEVQNNGGVDLLAETGADALADRLNAAVDQLLQAVDPGLAGGLQTPPEAAPARSI